MNENDFYRAFEDKFRGSRSVIKSRLQAYLPFILPLQEIYKNPLALDLGCGRGEWLELLRDNNFKATGIDLDDGMLQACYELNLTALQGDAISYLETVDNSSQCVVSAFHVVEHISFDKLHILIKEALRVLKPGGLLILETPNPENIGVGTNNFYLDPTHIRPIPYPLLHFFSEYHGFIRSKFMGMNSCPGNEDNGNIGINQIIHGVSPDYAVISQKEANESIQSQFDKAFSKDYGKKLHELISLYDNEIKHIKNQPSLAELQSELLQLPAKFAAETQDRLQKSEAHIHDLNLRNLELQQQLNIANSSNDALILNNQDLLQKLDAENDTVNELTQRNTELLLQNRASQKEVNTLKGELRENKQSEPFSKERITDLELIIRAHKEKINEQDEAIKLLKQECTTHLHMISVQRETENSQNNTINKLQSQYQLSQEQLSSEKARGKGIEQQLQTIESYIVMYRTQNIALQQSMSWRITSPLRYFCGIANTILNKTRVSVNHLNAVLINSLHQPLSILMKLILHFPAAGFRINQILLRHPALQQQLKQIAQRNEIIADTQLLPQSINAIEEDPATSHPFYNQNPIAREILQKIKSPAKNRMEGD